MVTLMLAACSLASCGVYTLNPRGKSDVKTIAIEPFENKTPEFGLADRLTAIVIDAFIADGNLKVVPLHSADVALVAVLSKYQRAVEKFDENQTVKNQYNR